MIKKSAIGLACFLSALLIYVYSFQMFMPGKLSKSHQSLKNKCLNCHTIFMGISKEKCMACHKQIAPGRGEENKVIPEAHLTRKKMHHYLSENNCIACHSEHKGVYGNTTPYKFNHGMFQESIQTRCVMCHEAAKDEAHKLYGSDCQSCHQFKAWRPAEFNHRMFFNKAETKIADQRKCAPCHKIPQDIRHKNFGVFCKDCHVYEAWKPASFNHSKFFESNLSGMTGPKKCVSCHSPPQNESHKKFDKQDCQDCHYFKAWKPAKFDHKKYFKSDLPMGVKRKECISCHQKPGDSLHRDTKKRCIDCHTFDNWKKVSFDHSKYFRFDGDHGPRCSQCHLSNGYKKYTCYQCHEHSERKIRASHRTIKTRNLNNCVKCHRSAAGEGEGTEGGEGDEGEEGDDD